MVDEKMNDLFSEENKKAAMNELKDKKLLGKIIDTYDEYKDVDFTLLKFMLVDWYLCRYRLVHLDTIAIIAIAVLYRVLPSDVIADKIPWVGTLDDKAVIAAAMARIAVDVDAYKDWRTEENERQISIIKGKFNSAQRLELIEVVEEGFSDYRFDIRDNITMDTILFRQVGGKLKASILMEQITVFKSPGIFLSMNHLLKNEVMYMDKIYAELSKHVEDLDGEDNTNDKIF